MATIKLLEVGLIENGDKRNKRPDSITRPIHSLPWLKDIVGRDRETFVTLHLDTRNCPIAMEVVSIGTLNGSMVHPREVFKAAILNNAAQIILAHNHPSGDPTPSREDIELTKRMREAGELLGIEVLDHLIVTADQGFFSMKEGNLF